MIQTALPNAARQGTHQMPLDADIGQLLAPYCPGGRQGISKQNNDYKCTYFAGHFDGGLVSNGTCLVKGENFSKNLSDYVTVGSMYGLTALIVMSQWVVCTV